MTRTMVRKAAPLLILFGVACWGGWLAAPQALPPVAFHFQTARALLAAGHARAALRELDLAARAHEVAPATALWRAKCYAALGEWAPVPALLQGYLERHPDQEEALYWLGAAQFHLRQFDAAQATLQQAVSANPRDGAAWRVLGLVALEHDQRRAAYEDWQRAVAVNPRDAEACYLIGRLFYESNYFSESDQWMSRTMAITPHDYRAAYYRGLAQEALGKLEAALTLYQASIRESRAQQVAYAWPYGAAGRLLTKLSRLAEAQQVIEAGLQRAPDARVYTAYGELLAQQHDWSKAEAALRHAVTLDPALPDPHYPLSRVLTALGARDAAALEMTRFRQLQQAQRPRQR